MIWLGYLHGQVFCTPGSMRLGLDIGYAVACSLQ